MFRALIVRFTSLTVVSVNRAARSHRFVVRIQTDGQTVEAPGVQERGRVTGTMQIQNSETKVGLQLLSELRKRFKVLKKNGEPKRV